MECDGGGQGAGAGERRTPWRCMQDGVRRRCSPLTVRGVHMLAIQPRFRAVRQTNPVEEPYRCGHGATRGTRVDGLRRLPRGAPVQHGALHAPCRCKLLPCCAALPCSKRLRRGMHTPQPTCLHAEHGLVPQLLSSCRCVGRAQRLCQARRRFGREVCHRLCYCSLRLQRMCKLGLHALLHFRHLLADARMAARANARPQPRPRQPGGWHARLQPAFSPTVRCSPRCPSAWCAASRWSRRSRAAGMPAIVQLNSCKNSCAEGL